MPPRRGQLACEHVRMDEDAELKALRARVAELEGQTAAREGRRGRIGRVVVSGIALVLAVILVPVAVLGTWARLQLVDTDRFVATFAPLAQEPSVQAFVEDQAIAAINDNVDITGTVDDLFDGLSGLDLPDRAKTAIGLLRAPATQGVESLITAGVHRVVTSDAFAAIWEGALRQTHARAVAIIQGQPGTALRLSDDGTLSIDVGVVVAEVKERLQQQRVGIADLIPEVTRAVPITTSSSLTLIRTLYNVAVAAGLWLSWLVLGLIVVGVVVARNRLRALAWTALGAALSLVLLAAGLGVGRLFFVGAVSPAIMPAATADVVFHQLTELMLSTTIALIMLSVLVAIGAWLAGHSRWAIAVRGTADATFGSARAFADAHGLGTGRFGRGLERWRTTILVVVCVVAALAVFLTRPVTTASVVTAVVCVVIAVLLLELLRRPQDAAAQPPISASIGPRAK